MILPAIGHRGRDVTTSSSAVRIAGLAGIFIISLAVAAGAQNNSSNPQQTSPNSIAAQPNAAPSSASGGVSSQGGGEDATLEIAPQPGMRPPTGSTDVIPNNREFRPGEDSASINRNFRPGQEGALNKPAETGVRKRPYLGITVEYTTQCYLGMEEHGLEVVSIDPNSPAEKAGMKPRGNTAIGAVAETASAFLGPLQMLTNPLVEKATAGEHGDLIVAVDDHRVRSRADLDDEMAKLKPGDTLYLTVIRPTAGGHKTMKIAVKVGEAGELAQAAPAPGAAPAPQPAY
jgi:hypothetical protein